MQSIITYIIIALCVAAALWSMFRRRGRGGCDGCGDKSGCGSCGVSQKNRQKKQ